MEEWCIRLGEKAQSPPFEDLGKLGGLRGLTWEQGYSGEERCVFRLPFWGHVTQALTSRRAL